MSQKLFIIDGYGQIFRSYYAFMQNPLVDSRGKNISAVYGFFTTLMSLIKAHNPDYVAVALDSPSKTFRHELFKDYKANREAAPEDLYEQIPIIIDILDKMKIRHFEQPGLEADDIIASVAACCKKNDVETVIVTADKDLMQLVDEKVSALRPPRKGEHDWRLCHSSDVVELFGVRPDQIVDYLTILGDASDNVPGIHGIGEKGAVKILTEYDTLDNAYANLDKMTKSVREKLEASRDNVPLSRTLITLKDDYTGFCCDSCLTSLIDWASGMQAFTDLESSKLVSVAKSFLPKNAKVTVVPKAVSLETGEFDTSFEVPADFTVDIDDYSKMIGYDLKEKLKELWKRGLDGKPFFDLKIAAWLLDSSCGKYSLDDICQKYLGNRDDDKNVISSLYWILSKKLEKAGLEDVFFNLEMPLVTVLAKIEVQGLLINPNVLKDYEKELVDELINIESEIYNVCGHSFNISSPKQLQEVLFVERNLPTGKKTKAGFSTDSDVLEDLVYRTQDPLPSLILKFRALNKLLTTYVSTLGPLADPSTGRIYTTLDQTGTATGRLSSKNPNLQNIPVRTEEGRRIRSAFVAAEGNILLSADYSQIELAVLAHLSKDPELCRSFSEGLDIHKATAALIFDIFPEMVTPEQRRIAKTINFGVVYGMSAFRLGNDLGIPFSQANGFIKTYFERYSALTSYIEDIRKRAEKDLFVKTEMGHIRYVPELGSSNKNIKSAAERAAFNTVIQGTAAEIVKRAMIRVDSELVSRGLKARIILQVHDEIIIEMPLEEQEIVTELVRKSMEESAMLTIPLKVSIECAKSWGSFH